MKSIFRQNTTMVTEPEQETIGEGLRKAWELDPTPQAEINPREPYQVSVVIPTYSGTPARDLVRAVESCLVQLIRVQVVVVYDGDPDGIRWLPTHPDIITKEIPKSGQAAAQNVGMGIATGEYQILLADDDWFEPGVFRLLIAAADKDRYAYGNVRVPQGVHRPAGWDGPHKKGDAFRCGYAVMWHSRAWDAGLRYFKPDHLPGYYEDYDFVLQLERLGMVGEKIEDVVWHYEERIGGLGQKAKGHESEILDILWRRNERYDWE